MPITLSAVEIDSLLESRAPQDVLLDYPECGLQVTVRTHLSISETSAFIDRVADNCFLQEEEYAPEFRDVLFQTAFLQTLTDLPAPALADEPDRLDLEAAYRIMTRLDVVRKGAEKSAHLAALVKRLERAVTEKICWNKQRFAKSTGMDALMEAALRMADRVDGLPELDSVKALLSQKGAFAGEPEANEHKVVAFPAPKPGEA